MASRRTERPTIGLSANVLHGDPDRDLYGGRPLLYLEQSMGTWLMRAGARPYLVPFAPEEAGVRTSVAEMVDPLDGLLLQGGADIAPESYGADPVGDVDERARIRDRYERRLVEAALDRGIPILGICRGLQMLNVVFGGTLIQELDGREEYRRHRDREQYDDHVHRVSFEPGGYLADLYGRDGGEIVSVHHQAVDEPGDGLVVEARADDGVVEALRLEDEDRYLLGVQWHPEFQDPGDDRLLDPAPLAEDFVAAAATRRDTDPGTV